MYEDDGPVYMQLARLIAGDILAGTYPEGSAVPSAAEYAAFHRMNAATANKGVHVLLNQGVLFSQRGIGMFVAAGAVEKLRAQGRAEFRDRHVAPLVQEAHALGIRLPELIELITEEDQA